jgi:cytoskeletal protein CcmA (bactofilin family)
MKFFDPKKKENSTMNNPASAPKPSNVQSSIPVSNPYSQPASVIPEKPKVETVKLDPVKLEPVKPEPVKPEPVKPEPVRAELRPAAPAAPTVTIPVPEMPKSAPIAKTVGKTLIGNTVIIRGDITSEENLQIEGVVDGSIESNNDVHVGIEGRVNATIRANNIVIHGRVIGDIAASSRVELAPSALLQGNIRAPKLAIAETALFKGSIDMRPRETSPVRENKEKNIAALETVEK